ncbi:hypothetical protein C4D60_Mb06t35800 [Musa balbisiana]|uniref:Uncharacterized protein n=1 Tax=Musa balbisiana TaxID=52838 RepID=A0A4S8IT14_MUSBA|nr:hypothetical protein C4D60_Mb06t35800 [Musa balbisiana]
MEVERRTTSGCCSQRSCWLSKNAAPRERAVQLREHPADGVRQELDLCRRLVVLRARHLDHPAALPIEDLEERAAPLHPVVGVTDPDFVVGEREPGPAVLAAVGAEHGMRAQDVEVRGQQLEEEVPGELLDGEDVNEQRAAAETLDGQRPEHGLGG